jgi:hypothetical protein
MTPRPRLCSKKPRTAPIDTPINRPRVIDLTRVFLLFSLIVSPWIRSRFKTPVYLRILKPSEHSLSLHETIHCSGLEMMALLLLTSSPVFVTSDERDEYPSLLSAAKAGQRAYQSGSWPHTVSPAGLKNLTQNRRMTGQHCNLFEMLFSCRWSGQLRVWIDEQPAIFDLPYANRVRHQPRPGDCRSRCTCLKPYVGGSSMPIASCSYLDPHLQGRH